jgi:diguanylate cyclase
LEEELKTAIFNERLVPYYQPVMDLQTYRVVGFEALVRWPQTDGRVVGPGHFVPLAQEVGLIAEIDALVLRAACRQVRQWQELGLCGADLEIGVNLSAGQLTDPELAERTAAQLEACRFDPRSLVLEITESEMITDNEVTMGNLAALRELGVRIALDDFGTGYSTFSHLDRLPIDIVKIDQSFVKTLGSADDSRSMAAAVVQLAKTLGYDTIAEGVENSAQEDSLRALGCARAQGYHLGKPMGAEAARWLLAAHTLPEPGGDAVSA